ncbi:MAG: RNA polymerase sigma factor SigZ [Magnetococcales bacterium]|nr:RNA polymerase sigma factor SigZ [Magnetococcales bacterium]
MSQTTETVWRHTHDDLYRFIRNRIDNDADADDILQEVFCRLHDRLDTIREPTRIRSWLYRVARNTIIDHYRSRRPHDQLPEMLLQQEMEPSEEARQEIERCLLPMIEALPEHYRQAVWLSEIEGVTQKEVAERQNLTLSGAKSRVQRGRALVKTMLDDCCRFEFDHRGTLMNYQRKKKNDCTKC